MQETPEFIVDTAVDVRKVRLEESGYIRLDERRRFWCPELTNLRGRIKAPEVREEPENPHVCYVNVDGRWVTAKGGGAPLFQTLDPVKRLAESLTKEPDWLHFDCASHQVSCMLRSKPSLDRWV